MLIRHKDDAEDVKPGKVTRKAFDAKWRDKGHVIVDAKGKQIEGTEAPSSD